MTCAGDEQVDKMMTSGYGRWCLLSACLALHDEDLSIWKRLTVPYQLARCSEHSNWNYSMIICLLAPHGLLLLVSFTGLLHIPGGCLGWLPSTVVLLGPPEAPREKPLGKARAFESDPIFPSLHHSTGLPPATWLLHWLVFCWGCPKAQESLQNISTKTNQNPSWCAKMVGFSAGI